MGSSLREMFVGWRKKSERDNRGQEVVTGLRENLLYVDAGFHQERLPIAVSLKRFRVDAGVVGYSSSSSYLH